MYRAVMDDDEVALRLDASISGLAERAPVVSVRRLLSGGQAAVFGTLLIAIGLGLIVDPFGVLEVLGGVITAVYLACVVYRFRLFVRSTRSDVSEVVSDGEALSLVEDDLPTYTVLVPMYREADVVGSLIANLSRLDYPSGMLEILLLVEDDDAETIEAVHAHGQDPRFRLVVVPAATPRTKPKALNFGLGLARGELVAIYDAEDEPEVLQLRRAAATFRRLGPEVGCLQAKLAYNNPDQNLITRWFAIEYAMWFTFFLPGLSSLGAPIPLGGTSNHFRRRVLRSLGGWDPYNVTEDADLGVRVCREGYSVKVLESVTLEEANSDFVNWVKQRSRWYKGYMQTFLVHMRSPRRLRREVGWSGVGHFCTFVGGTPLLALLNPIFWVMTVIWFVAHPAFIERIFPAPVYYVGLLCWSVGNFLLCYLTLLSCRAMRAGTLLGAALVIPGYWLMMSLGAAKAVWQLVGAPNFWEKTVHGLSRRSPASRPEVGGYSTVTPWPTAEGSRTTR
jgi:glycosyltransferase XagB